MTRFKGRRSPGGQQFALPLKRPNALDDNKIQRRELKRTSHHPNEIRVDLGQISLRPRAKFEDFCGHGASFPSIDVSRSFMLARFPTISCSSVRNRPSWSSTCL